MVIFLITKHNICRLGEFNEVGIQGTRITLCSEVCPSYIEFKDEQLAKRVYKKISEGLENYDCECFIQL